MVNHHLASFTTADFTEDGRQTEAARTGSIRVAFGGREGLFGLRENVAGNVARIQVKDLIFTFAAFSEDEKIPASKRKMRSQEREQN